MAHQDQIESATPVTEPDEHAPRALNDLSGTSLETRAARVRHLPPRLQRSVLTQLGRTAGNRYVQQLAGAMQHSAPRVPTRLASIPTTRNSQVSAESREQESDQSTLGDETTRIAAGTPTAPESPDPSSKRRSSVSTTTTQGNTLATQTQATQVVPSQGTRQNIDSDQRQTPPGAPGANRSSTVEVAAPGGKPAVVATTAGAPDTATSPPTQTAQEPAAAQKLPAIPHLPAKQDHRTRLQDISAVQDLKQAVVQDQGASAGSGDTNGQAGAKLSAEQEQASGRAQQKEQKLQATDAETAQLAGLGMQFTLPQAGTATHQQTGQVDAQTGAATAADPTPALEHRRAEASKLANTFLSTASQQIQAITQLGQPIPARVAAMTTGAKAAITAAVAQQRTSVAAQIAQQRSQAQREAQATIGQIRSQQQAALAAIVQSTATSRKQIAADYSKARAAIDVQEQQQSARIHTLYQAADRAYRAAGVTVGREATARGAAAARGFESQITGKDDSLLDGPVTDNRLKARAKAAREVAQQYNQGLVEEANKQASAGQQGKTNDLATVRAMAAQARQTLAAQHAATLQSLASAEAQARQQTEQAGQSLTATVNRTLKTTLHSLTQQQVAQVRLLTGYGQRQVTALDRDAQKAIAALQGGVNQAAAKLRGMLGQFQREMHGTTAPDPAALSGVLAGANQQIMAAVAAVRAQTERGVLASTQGIQRGGQQAIPALAAIGQGAAQEATTTRAGLSTTLAQLQRGAADTFGQVQKTHTSTLSQLSHSAAQGFTQLTSSVKAQFDQLGQNLEQGLSKSAQGLEEGLRGALKQLDADIKKYGDQAAAEVQPRWKTVAKVLLVIAVIVVVALVIGPAVIGAVGAAAGALGASAATAGAVGAIVGGAIVGAASGAVIQMGSNLIDGKNVMDGVGKAMIVGAIGGALGGAGGVVGNALGNAGKLGAGISQTVLKTGIDAGFDIVGGVLGDLAVGNPLTLEGILIGAGIGAAVSFSVTGLGSIKGSIVKNNVEGGPPKPKPTDNSAHNAAGFERLKAQYAQQEVLGAEPTGSALKGGSGHVRSTQRMEQVKIIGPDGQPKLVNKKVEGIRDVNMDVDVYHSAPIYMQDRIAQDGRVFALKDNGGKQKTLIQMEGGVNDKDGIFEYIVDENGLLVHQIFIPGGKVTGVPGGKATHSPTNGSSYLDEVNSVPTGRDLGTGGRDIPSHSTSLPQAPKMEANTPRTSTDVDKPKMATGAKKGVEPSPESIHEGTVRMEDHPDYHRVMEQVKSDGYEIVYTEKDPRVWVQEVVDPDGKVLRVEKQLHVQKGMRFIDLEHEIGHINQHKLFEKGYIPLERVVEYPNGRIKRPNDQKETLTNWRDTITEYHNRLVEYIRLCERGVNLEVLREHAEALPRFRTDYLKKGLNQGRSSNQKAWADQYFSDIGDLAAKARESSKKYGLSD